MLTIEGTHAPGIGDEIRSIELGKRVDLVLLDVDTPKFTPPTNVQAHVVTTVNRRGIFQGYFYSGAPG